MATHEVFNQSPPRQDDSLLDGDIALKEALVREGAGEAAARLGPFARQLASAEMREVGRRANRHLPQLRTHDAKGRRLDLVEYHPAYHALMGVSASAGLHLGAFEPTEDGAPRAGGHVERAAGFYMTTQIEAGHCCPITMTHAAIPAISAEAGLAERWLPLALVRDYDSRLLPAAKKRALTFGMGMTEKQGGTDVRANTTRAQPVAGEGDGAYRLTGHKWFLSAPMSDAFLMLAQAEAGLTCFLVPRLLPDGSLNGLRLQRLKDKLGNRSNASGEVEIEGALGHLVGEPGRGVAAIMEMVTHTRLDCALCSAGLMRAAVADAIHHARHRNVGGRPLASEPLMQQVLADLVLEVEAALALSFRLARSFDHAGDARAAAWKRLMTPVTKFWVCKVAPGVIGEAMECLGGNGYVEEGDAARNYREAPVNSIWEGSGNVMALDVLRVLQREPEVVETVVDELTGAVGEDAHLKAALRRLSGLLHEPRLLDVRARALVEGFALLAAAAILRAHAPAAVADGFIATRLSGIPRHCYGQGLEWTDVAAIMARALPA